MYTYMCIQMNDFFDSSILFMPLMLTEESEKKN